MTLPLTAFNMHTDMVIAGDGHGGLYLTAKNSTGVSLSVWITSAMADRLGTACGRSSAPNADPHAPAPNSPYNMHTDAQTHIDPVGTKVVIDGPADPPGGGSAVELKLTINGTALTALRNS